MAATDPPLTVLEKSHMSPPPNTVSNQSLPLTFFDLPWLLLHPIHNLFFYDFPHPKSHFIQTIIPKLKHSLSLTLIHFPPFAGNLTVFPAKNHEPLLPKPEIRYVDGDSLAVTFAESHLDFFNDLKQNHPRECNRFYSLVPVLETPVKVSSGLVKIPVFSVQVTVFLGSGFTIGLTNHHSLCDARTRYDFLMTWSSIAKRGSDEVVVSESLLSLPVYDRVIEYPDSLDEMLLRLPPIRALDESYRAARLDPATERVRSTFVLTRPQINVLKKRALGELPTLEYVSSFAVGCGYVWSCIAKSRVRVVGPEGEYEVERFMFAADFRVRLDPPVSPNYFGNCVGLCAAATKTTLLSGNEGFTTAVALIATAIREGVNSGRAWLKEAGTWLEKALVQVPTIGVAGTPKLNVYDVDFGWGKPEKYETISTDFSDAISVNASKDSSEDLEIGLCLTKKQMDAFIDVSGNELKRILSHQ